MSERGEEKTTEQRLIEAIELAVKDEWEASEVSARAREQVVKSIASEMEMHAAKEIASIDLFVEKAQADLGRRSSEMIMLAKCALVFSGAGFIFGIGLLGLYHDRFVINPSDWKTLIASIVSNATFLGFVLGPIYVALSLFRSFMHEATTLKNRVHSTRLGRLFLYIKYISANKYEVDAVRSALTASEIEKVFGWNIETSTAFKDINPHIATKTMVGSAVESALDKAGSAAKK